MLTTSPSMVSHYVPLELINSILPRLPVKALIRFLCVSKEWSALINSSNFIKKQLNHSIETNSDRTLILKETIRNPPLQSRFFSVPYYDNDQFGKVVQIYQPLLIGTSWTSATAWFAFSFISTKKRMTSQFGIH